MFRKLYNQAVITGTLVPDGPILIVQGGGVPDPVAADLSFVRSRRGGVDTVYLPGSSLKGVLRAHAERLLATEAGEAAAENPFEFKAPNRQRAREQRKENTPGVYRLSCAADRLFGSTEIAGRFRIGDAYPDETAVEAANRTEIRYGVAISRAKQSVQVGPFEQEAVTGGSFQLHATLENFELWMLCLLLQAFEDLNSGFVQIGHAKSRGFGSVKVSSPKLQLRWPGRAPERLEGAGARERDERLRLAYGLREDDIADLPEQPAVQEDGLFGGYDFCGPAIKQVRVCCGERWQAFVHQQRTEGGHGL